MLQLVSEVVQQFDFQITLLMDDGGADFSLGTLLNQNLLRDHHDGMETDIKIYGVAFSIVGGWVVLLMILTLWYDLTHITNDAKKDTGSIEMFELTRTMPHASSSQTAHERGHCFHQEIQFYEQSEGESDRKSSYSDCDRVPSSKVEEIVIDNLHGVNEDLVGRERKLSFYRDQIGEEVLADPQIVMRSNDSETKNLEAIVEQITFGKECIDFFRGPPSPICIKGAKKLKIYKRNNPTITAQLNRIYSDESGSVIPETVSFGAMYPTDSSFWQPAAFSVGDGQHTAHSENHSSECRQA